MGKNAILALFLAISFLAFRVAAFDCNNPLSTYHHRYGRFYKLSDRGDLSYSEAKDECEADGTQLAAIYDVHTYEYLTETYIGEFSLMNERITNYIANLPQLIYYSDFLYSVLAKFAVIRASHSHSESEPKGEPEPKDRPRSPSLIGQAFDSLLGGQSGCFKL